LTSSGGGSGAIVDPFFICLRFAAKLGQKILKAAGCKEQDAIYVGWTGYIYIKIKTAKAVLHLLFYILFS